MCFSTSPDLTRALRYHATGKAAEVLRLESIAGATVGKDEVRIALVMAPIHPSDLGMIGGTYGRLRQLPAIAGREGLGRVVEAGSGATQFPVGTRVRMPDAEGTWRESVVAKASALIRVPSTIPAEQACMAFINPPTAILLLQNFVPLQPGDWIIQNAANSAVGECVIQIAKSLGVHTVNLVRDPAKHNANLTRLGADLVLADDKDAAKTVASALQGKAPRLALNSIGGPSAITLARSLGDNGTLVTFGGMPTERIAFPTREFIFKNITCCGFWMDRWARTSPPEAVSALFDRVFALQEKGVLNMAVDSVHPLGEYAKAIARAEGYGRNGKVLLSSSADNAA
ncbi:MAG: 2-enoyl thioester reductase domain-containing protein [Puniceicoccales bacterium]|jgi:NADPH:quinone reductase-like Zn-dependent oxidoreductase|nr:2-enoyl thioester reductase domain-containing protein [Puniceicoccales bacterium]